MTSVSGANAQDYDKGSAAYNAGDYQTALKEILPLAESGDARAQVTIGVMYGDGAGVLQNDVEAIKWFRLAADQGNSYAQNIIGWMYANGRGVIQSKMISHMWLNIASANGYKDSATDRDMVAKSMTKKEISKAQAMAQECLSSGYKNCGE
jgi:TPR repeat protein